MACIHLLSNGIHTFHFSQVMLDTLGPELLLVNKSEHPIALEEDSFVILTPDQDKQASSDLLPINFSGLSKVKMLRLQEIS